MTGNTNIVRRKPYTIIVTRDDDVYIYDKSWEDTMDFLMEHGFIVLPRYKMTVQKWHIKKSFEVNNKTHTSVDNWIYEQPQERCKLLLKEHRDRKWLNWIGIKTIEQWQNILDRLQGKKPQKTAETKDETPDQKKPKKPLDRKKIREILDKARIKNQKKDPWKDNPNNIKP